MSATKTSPLVSEATLEEIDARGQAIYESKLKAQLEPAHNNEFVVIHVDTEDYAVARSFTRANREMLTRHPADGRLFGRKIGAEPEYGLAARILASDTTARAQK